MRKYSLAIVFLLPLLFSCFITPIHSALNQSLRVSSLGTVEYNPPANGPYGLILKYSTGFENVVKTSRTHLNLTIDNYLAADGAGSGMWIEGYNRYTPGFIPHNGSRCLGLEVNSTTRETHRSQLDVYIQNGGLVADEHYFSAWFYLPSDWHLTSSGYGWYSIADPYQELPDFRPQVEITVDGNAPFPPYNLRTTVRWPNGTYDENFGGRINNFPWPIGRWFKVEWYILRDNTDGIVKIWVDGIQLSNAYHVPLTYGTGYYITVAKNYYDSSDTIPKKIWVDDIEIYGKP